MFIDKSVVNTGVSHVSTEIEETLFLVNIAFRFNSLVIPQLLFTNLKGVYK